MSPSDVLEQLSTELAAASAELKTQVRELTTEPRVPAPTKS